MSEREIRIAVVQASDGHVTCIGPNDFPTKDFTDAMEAAISFHIEAGWMPVSRHWVSVALPIPSDEVPVLIGNPSPPKDTAHE